MRIFHICGFINSLENLRIISFGYYYKVFLQPEIPQKKTYYGCPNTAFGIYEWVWYAVVEAKI